MSQPVRILYATMTSNADYCAGASARKFTFSPSVAARSGGCTGREWVLEWLDPAGERLLTVRGPQAEAGNWELFLTTLS